MARSRPRITTITILVTVLGACGAAPAGEFVGIPDEDFASHYRPQRASMWCWASCIEMALSYAGVDLPQETIVAGQQGEGVNIGALPGDLVGTVNGFFRTVTGEEALVSSQYLSGVPSATVLYNHLSRRAPAILLYERAGGDGHAVVLTGIDVAVDPGRGIEIEAFHVFDPALGATEAGAPGIEPLACRRVYPAVRTDDGVAIGSGTIDGVVLLDSNRPFRTAGIR